MSKGRSSDGTKMKVKSQNQLLTASRTASFICLQQQITIGIVQRPQPYNSSSII